MLLDTPTATTLADDLDKENKEEEVLVEADGDDNSSDSSDVVHLGYCVPIHDVHDTYNTVGHSSPNWSLWDGGKVGGKPSFLIPVHILTRSQLQCCSKDMMFLLQIYCPSTSISEGAAFHRTIYVFVCSNNEMHTKGTSTNSSNCGGVKVFRCQLSRENSYYPSSIVSSEEEREDYYGSWKDHMPETWNVQTCKVCGVFATGKCPVQNAYFCGRNHQKEHMKYVYKSNNQGTNILPSIFPEYELVVEDEPCESNNNEDQVKMFHSIKSKSLFSNDEGQDDANLEQIDLNQMARMGGEDNKMNNGVTDRRTIEFYTRITRGGKSTSSQCLRYCRWPSTSVGGEHTDDDNDDDDVGNPAGVPLWISSECIPTDEDIPPCPYCGSIRKPEFQIMPQILNYLHASKPKSSTSSTDNNTIMAKEARDATIAAASIIEREGADDETKYQIEQKLQDLKNNILQGIKDELNFGPIVVYTCTNSCNEGNSRGSTRYLEEFAWRQPPLDEY